MKNEVPNCDCGRKAVNQVELTRYFIKTSEFCMGRTWIVFTCDGPACFERIKADARTDGLEVMVRALEN